MCFFFFCWKVLIFFSFFLMRTCCGYLLEMPPWHSTTYSCGEIRKICGYPSLSGTMVQKVCPSTQSDQNLPFPPVETLDCWLATNSRLWSDCGSTGWYESLLGAHIGKSRNRIAVVVNCWVINHRLEVSCSISNNVRYCFLRKIENFYHFVVCWISQESG